MLTASGSKPITKAEEILLVDRVQHRDRRPLDQLIFQGGNRNRPLSAIRLWYVLTAAGQRPVGSPMNPRMQISEVSVKVCHVSPSTPGAASRFNSKNAVRSMAMLM